MRVGHNQITLNPNHPDDKAVIRAGYMGLLARQGEYGNGLTSRETALIDVMEQAITYPDADETPGIFLGMGAGRSLASAVRDHVAFERSHSDMDETPESIDICESAASEIERFTGRPVAA